MTIHKKQIQQINDELYDIFESSFDEIFVTDANGYVLVVNSECEKNYALKVEDFIGKHVKELQEMGIFYPSATLKVIESNQAIELVQKTNSGRYLHVRTRPVFTNDGQLKSVISYSRDLTDLMELKRKVEEMEEQLENYKKELNESVDLEGIVTKSEAMKKVFSTIQRVASVNTTVLLLGETGVGKSRVAKLLHQLSTRKQQPYHELNCAALPEQLIESELFGYEGGTFTGAFREGKKGIIELSNEGTLFLDEIGELSLSAQSKLLHVLQDRTIRPVGSTRAVSIDVRIIAATNQNLEQMVEEGKFRRDLYYRLNVVPITIPPLRERKEDILPLVYQFLHHFNTVYERNVRLSPKALDAFLGQEWKGNVREVENIIERLVVTGEEMITLKDLPFAKEFAIDPPVHTLPEMIEHVEKEMVIKAFEQHRSSYKVAEQLGISQSQASRKIRKYVSDSTEQ
ncbi:MULTISPECIES: sigma-54 interaction domain-containing protein [Priestia]|uniref:HTH-type transcriptional regulatory protein TyrR n=3 Tax=Priestia TaxID=2800373 RepID=A0AAX6BPK6_PRIMG|nr:MULTISPECIES: sigma 54-interacting transcriptional regulator [Priestia]MBK0295352.1 sigma 54-interacting transcriptional regulator [Bacillus sp. S34]MCL9636284.1 sigma 54-interacting transcriptional regulator [Bacillus zanthoxyli]NHH92677.1 Arginine utilization regulatory protein RocR [Bacillus sp. MB95]UPK51166.1 sigma 54-interacting transcriptional regulator [Bacillus sp. H8-1]AKP79077.1 Arginine utilization regulatory protein RocR [Priestia megaterium Q3]